MSLLEVALIAGIFFGPFEIGSQLLQQAINVIVKMVIESIFD
jgi:hypothetical protein